MSELRELLERIAVGVGRMADANERLNSYVERDREEADGLADAAVYEAPQCPHCGKFDPKTQTPGGEGKLSDFVLASLCGDCGGTLYAIPLGWMVVGTKQEAAAYLARN